MCVHRKGKAWICACVPWLSVSGCPAGHGVNFKHLSLPSPKTLTQHRTTVPKPPRTPICVINLRPYSRPQAPSLSTATAPTSLFIRAVSCKSGLTKQRVCTDPHFKCKEVTMTMHYLRPPTHSLTQRQKYTNRLFSPQATGFTTMYAHVRVCTAKVSVAPVHASPGCMCQVRAHHMYCKRHQLSHCLSAASETKKKLSAITNTITQSERERAREREREYVEAVMAP